MNLTLIPTVELWKRHEQNRYQPEIRHEIAARKLFWMEVRAKEALLGGYRFYGMDTDCHLTSSYQRSLDLGSY